MSPREVKQNKEGERRNPVSHGTPVGVTAEFYGLLILTYTFSKNRLPVKNSLFGPSGSCFVFNINV